MNELRGTECSGRPGRSRIFGRTIAVGVAAALAVAMSGAASSAEAATSHEAVAGEVVAVSMATPLATNDPIDNWGKGCAKEWLATKRGGYNCLRGGAAVVGKFFNPDKAG
jgi:hypothetical protein